MRIHITVHGAVYALTGFLLLAAGLLRGELLSAACGGLLTLYTGFAAAAVAFTAFYWRHEEPSVTVSAVSTDDVTLTDGSAAGSGNPDAGCLTVTPSAAVFPRCAVGAAAFYMIVFSVSPDGTGKITEPAVRLSILLHKRRTVYHAGSIPRGKYFYRQRCLVLKDVCGFFAVRLLQPLPVSRTYIVLPALQPAAHSAPPELYAQSVTDAPQTERTTELYESRPYVPGDDPRKIHWKLYAHTGGLAVKLGAFEPPPVKHLTLYIEEPRVMRKKDQAFAAAVFDAFMGRIAAYILQLLHAGIQCSLLLYDYHIYGLEADSQVGTDALLPGILRKTYGSKVNPSGKVLRRFDLEPDDAAAPTQVLQLCAIPALQSAWRGLAVRNNQPDVAAVFREVPENSGLLYCYMPLSGSSDNACSKTLGGMVVGGTAMDSTVDGKSGAEQGSAITGVEVKIAASRRAGVQTVFYLADTPALSQPYAASGDGRENDRGHTRSGFCNNVRRLLYTSAAVTRQEAFYRRFRAAAAQELHIFAARKCYAQLL